MKKYKIEFQSFSDVITNSSSTVFLVDRNTSEELNSMAPVPPKSPTCCLTTGISPAKAAEQQRLLI